MSRIRVLFGSFSEPIVWSIRLCKISSESKMVFDMDIGKETGRINFQSWFFVGSFHFETLCDFYFVKVGSIRKGVAY